LEFLSWQQNQIIVEPFLSLGRFFIFLIFWFWTSNETSSFLFFLELAFSCTISFLHMGGQEVVVVVVGGGMLPDGMLFPSPKSLFVLSSWFTFVFQFVVMIHSIHDFF